MAPKRRARELPGRDGLGGQELKAGQGGLSSWEGRNKGNESRDGSTQERDYFPPPSSSSVSLHC